MGPHRAAALIATLLGAGSAAALEPGWHYSPLAGEGDRASLGCAQNSEPGSYTCLAVRCEDDYSTGLYIHASRPAGSVGAWEITVDGETRILTAAPASPYGGRFSDMDGWLLDGLRHGTVVYLRHEADEDGGFAQISLDGSFRAIAEALQWCAPRVPEDEQNAERGVELKMDKGEVE